MIANPKQKLINIRVPIIIDISGYYKDKYIIKLSSNLPIIPSIIITSDRQNNKIIINKKSGFFYQIIYFDI